MDLIEEKDLAGLERGKDGGQIALALEQRAGAGLDGYTQFVREDLRERRLAQARWPVEQDVVERLAAAARRLDGNRDVLLHPRLPDEIGQALGTHAGFNTCVFVKRLAGNDTLRRSLHLRLRHLRRRAGVSRLPGRPSAPHGSTAVAWRAAAPQSSRRRRCAAPPRPPSRRRGGRSPG